MVEDSEQTNVVEAGSVKTSDLESHLLSLDLQALVEEVSQEFSDVFLADLPVGLPPA